MGINSNTERVEPSAKALVVEDALSLQLQYRAQLEALGVVQVSIAANVAEAQLLIERQAWDVAIVDIGLPDGSGFEVIDRLLARWQGCSVVVVSGLDSLDLAMQAAQAGALDFLQKPFLPQRLAITLRNALRAAAMYRQIKSMDVLDSDRFYNFIGRSRVMQGVYDAIQKIANSTAPVFIHGESGVGKELAADAIHRSSTRSRQAFVPLNCAAIPHELIESELFGHVKGAFTGAQMDRDGAFMLADGGTLFLDEIAELDVQVQAKLLRVLQTGEMRRVGESKTRTVDVRIVSASHRNLHDLVEQGRFREDLFYRLHVIPLSLPPCASVARTFCCWPNTFSASMHNRKTKPWMASQRRHKPYCCATAGLAMCVN